MDEVQEALTDLTIDASASADDSAKVTKRKYIYWGIELDKDEILQNATVSYWLAEFPVLVPLSKGMHTTLQWIGRKSDIDDSHYHELIGKECQVAVSRLAVSDTAMALEVSDMVFVDNGEAVPAKPNKKQHITVALAPGEKAVDSVMTLTGEYKGYCRFAEFPLVLTGTLKGYKY
jgi:hypothetical protein